MDNRDIELLFYIAERREPPLNEIVKEFKKRWGVTDKAVYFRLKKLEKKNILKLRKLGRNYVLVGFSTDFLALIETLYGLMHGQAKYWYDRVRKKWVEQQ